MNIFSYNFSLRDIKKSDLIEFAKNPKSAPDTEVTIYMYISWGGKREKYKTSYRVRISDWEEIRLVKKNKEEYAKDVQRVKSGITGSEEINSYLDELELRIKAFDKECFEKNIIPSKEMAFNVLDGKNAEAPKSEVIMESLTVFKAFEKFIEDSEKGERRTKKGKRISDNTIKQYKSVKRILKEFQEYDKSTLTWGSFNCKNDKFYNRVTNFCWHYKGYFDNYTGHFIKYLKSFLNWVERQEIVSHKLYSENWIVWSEEIDIVVFYPDEMKILFNMELEGLEETRDMFIAGCMTCLRVSNLLALTESDLKSDYLNIVLVKTDKPIKIPVNPILKSIFSKYLLKYNRLLPRISEQEFNYKLKDLAKKFEEHISQLQLSEDHIGNEWGKLFTRIRFKQGKPIKEFKPMTEMVSTHTMRRTGITNLLMAGLSEIEVKDISGHAMNSKEFQKYVNIAKKFIEKKSNIAWSNILGEPTTLKKVV